MPFIELQSVDSTNNYARRQIDAGLALHGSVYFAHEQWAGKGQRGKTWETEQNSNIALTVVIKPLPLLIHQQFQLSACIALAVNDFFVKYAGEETRIKWPNDLYWQDRKAGGILIESGVGSGAPGVESWQWAIVGIGININQISFPEWLPNPVSLKQISGKTFDPVSLAKELCECIDKNFQLLLAGRSDQILSSYNSSLYKRNEKVKLKKGSRVFEPRIKEVSPSGKLIVIHGSEEEFDFGEVKWL